MADYNIADSLKFGITIFSILNPLGALPMFLTLTFGRTHKGIKHISTTCAVTVFITSIVSLVLGKAILSMFGISIPSFRIGGGVLLAAMALSMMAAKQQQTKLSSEEIAYQESEDTIGIVPLAIPLLAGPGTISTSIVYSSEFSTVWHWIGAFVAMAVICVAIKYILQFSEQIGKRIGTIGLNVLTRIMGLITMAIAVEFIAVGVKQFFPNL